jgi:uncharacterized protein DUF2637
LIIDGLLTTATVELWRPGHGGGRWRAWLAFLFGVALSLCANIASAPELTVFAVVVAACPPLALLLAVELLNRALKRHRTEAAHSETVRTTSREATISRDPWATLDEVRGVEVVVPIDQGFGPVAFAGTPQTG